MKSTLQSFQTSPFRCIKHSTYFAVYDRLFAPYVGQPIVFVEVGVLDGGSLFMWRDYFGPQARIIGVDFNPAATRWREQGFEIYIGNQADPAFWQAFFRQAGEIDLMLDDGGHTFEQQIITVEESLPHIRNGGLLAVEDTHTSYMRAFNGPSRHSFISYAKNIADGVNHRFSRFAGSRPYEKRIHGVRFYESIVAFEVDGRLCAVPELLDNGGKASQSADFRYADMGFAASADQPGIRYRAFRKLARYLANAQRNLKLRRFFRY